MKLYSEYKDSGVEGLGMVPRHWQIHMLRSMLTRVSEKNKPKWPLLSVVRDKGVILRNRSSKEENHNFIPDDLSNYKVVRKNQFVMNKMKSWQGSYGISEYNGIVSPAYYVFDIEGCLSSFFHLSIRSRLYIQHFMQASTGIRPDQWDLNINYMKDIPFLIPSLYEQQTIVDYLNRETAEMDALITEQEELVSLLKQKRSAIISEAVCRGLDPTVPMKDSGVEWLGMVPTVWKVSQIGRYYEVQLGKMLQTKKVRNDDLEVPYFKVQNIQWSGISEDNVSLMFCSASSISQYSIEQGDLLICEGGEVGRSAIVDRIYKGYIIQNALHRVRGKNGNYNKFLYYVMVAVVTTGWIDQLCNKATIAHFTKEKLSKLQIPIPPLSEQKSIVNYLDHETSEIDHLIADCETSIQLLKQRRTALISEAVTGKIDVRTA